MFKIIQNLRYEFDNSEFTGKLKDVTLVKGPRSHIFGEVSLFKMLRQLGYLVKKKQIAKVLVRRMVALSRSIQIFS